MRHDNMYYTNTLCVECACGVVCFTCVRCVCAVFAGLRAVSGLSSTWVMKNMFIESVWHAEHRYVNFNFVQCETNGFEE